MSSRVRFRIAATMSLLALAHGAGAADANARKKLDDSYIPFTGAEFVKRVFLSDKKTVELFLQAGFAVDTPDEKGYTALRRAADQSDGKMLAVLLAAGADPNLADKDGTTALCVATEGGANVNVNALLRAKANPRAACGFDKNTPLHLAARKGDLRTLQALLAAGVQVDARNRTGETPLHQAAAWGESMPVLQALLAAGADLKAKDHGGDTPLHGANNHRSVPFVQALLAAGADVNARNGRGETALFEAARNDHAGLINLLLQSGADVTLTDSTGMTPLSIAKQVGSMRAMELLKGGRKEAKP